jgi:Tfp pilus assembly protein PilF
MAGILMRDCVDEMDAYDAAISHGQHHLSLGEYEAAVAAFTAAIRVCPEMRLAYVYRASAYEMMGDEVRSGADLAVAHRFGQ